MQVQTRNDIGEIKRFNAMQEAYTAWKQDSTIWKISFIDKDDKPHRFRPKYNKERDKWSESSEAKLELLSEAYRNASKEQLFWVDQPLALYGDLTDMIVTIYSDEEFRRMFNYVSF